MHWLDMIKVRDLMRSEVVTLHDDAPIREALETFESEHISGAPVVDSAGRPVGVLSAFDVAQSRHLLRDRLADQRGDYDYGFYDEEAVEGLDLRRGEAPSDDPSPSLLGRETVADRMHPGVVHVAPETSLRTVCELMDREGIHRVLVMQDARLVGILSTMDVVRYLASGTGY